MEEKISNEVILEKLNEIIDRLSKIEKEIQYIKKGSENMTEHISFVENIYDTIKNPFYYVISKIKPIEKIPEKPKRLKYED